MLLAGLAWFHLKRWPLCCGAHKQHPSRAQIDDVADCGPGLNSSEAVAAVLRRTQATSLQNSNRRLSRNRFRCKNNTFQYKIFFLQIDFVERPIARFDKPNLSLGEPISLQTQYISLKIDHFVAQIGSPNTKSVRPKTKSLRQITNSLCQTTNSVHQNTKSLC